MMTLSSSGLVTLPVLLIARSRLYSSLSTISASLLVKVDFFQPSSTSFSSVCNSTC